MRVINGKEKGGTLNTIKDFDAKKLQGLDKHSVFLDNLTGDYYKYD